MNQREKGEKIYIKIEVIVDKAGYIFNGRGYAQ